MLRHYTLSKGGISIFPLTGFGRSLASENLKCLTLVHLPHPNLNHLFPEILKCTFQVFPSLIFLIDFI